MKFYYCDACHYCFEGEELPSRCNDIPDRCPDCGARVYREQPAVRLARKNEIDELLRMRAEDKASSPLPIHSKFWTSKPDELLK